MSGDSASQRRAIRSGEYRIPGCNDADADLKRPAPQGQCCSLPARVRGCARTAWHSHTIAQTLYVTEGQARRRPAAHSRMRRADRVLGPFGRRPQRPFADPTLSEISAAHGKPVAQAVLRWLIQREVVIPEDCPRRRMRENIDVFDFALTDQDMTCIAAITPAPPIPLPPRPTGGVGVDVSIEAVGYPETLLTAASLVRPGGTIANIGVHGVPVSLPMQDMWIQNVTLTMGLVDTVSIPTLLKMVASGRIPAEKMGTHSFTFAQMGEAYDVFANAAENSALKVVITPS
jgi:hypothetical protein